MRPVFSLVVALSVGGCATSSTEPATVQLVGQVLRGPLTPVCVPAQPCEGPFAARFLVYRGNRIVAVFRSDIEGQFAVALAPGGYSVQPDADAPIMSPAGQTRQVLVGSEPVTTVQLHFDTGLR